MKRPLPSESPKFKSDEETAAFMEQYSAFDLVDVGLADIVPTPLFVRAQEEKKTLLKTSAFKLHLKGSEKLMRKNKLSSISKADTLEKMGGVLG